MCQRLNMRQSLSIKKRVEKQRENWLDKYRRCLIISEDMIMILHFKWFSSLFNFQFLGFHTWINAMITLPVNAFF